LAKVYYTKQHISTSISAVTLETLETSNNTEMSRHADCNFWISYVCCVIAPFDVLSLCLIVWLLVFALMLRLRKCYLVVIA